LAITTESAAPTAIVAVRVAPASGEERAGVARLDEVLDPERVVAEAHLQLRAHAARERAHERADDRELLPVEEVEPEDREVDLEDLHRLAHEQAEQVLRLEQQEAEAAGLTDAGRERPLRGRERRRGERVGRQAPERSAGE
jgi:hypothetical protein